MSLKRWIFFLLGAAAVTGCSLVDEEIRDCGTDQILDYELRMETDITTELETELSLDTEVAVATALEAYLGDVFTDKAHDIDLSFYNTSGEYERLHHERHIMDASETSYTLSIPVREYIHTAVANLDGAGTVTLQGDETCYTAVLEQSVRDTLPSQRTGIFTARLPMQLREGTDQSFNVHLSMANCAASIVLDTLDSHVKDIRVYATGFATAFELADSVYRYQYSPIIVADKVETEEPGSPLCFASVTFPSKDGNTKAETLDGLWNYRIYATLPDGSVTETLLSFPEPLGPGQLRVVKAKVYGNGTLYPEDQTVGVSVTLDWEPGMEHELDL